MLWVTNTGDEVCDTTTLQLALAAWGLWLNWEDAEDYTLPFVAPGDTVLITMQEMRACNEEYYLEVDWLNPIFVDHYDYVEAPADSGMCDTFYIGNPTTGPITVNVTIDSVVGTDWDVIVSPTVFTLAPGDSQAISICSGYSGWFDYDTLDYDSLWIDGGGALTFVSATAEDSSRRPLELSDFQLRQGRFRHYVNLWSGLPNMYGEFVTMIQLDDIDRAGEPHYKNWNIRMENSSPFEYNIDLTGYWYGSDKHLEKVSFRAVNPDNPYMVTYPSDAKLLHCSFTDASGIGDSDAAVNIQGTDEFYAKQLLIQSAHGSYALKLESPSHIEGLIINDAEGGVKIFNEAVIEDFTFDDISGSAIDLMGGNDLDLIASQAVPEDVSIYGSGMISFYSRGRILVEDTLGEGLEGIAFSAYWGPITSFSGVTNDYGGHSPFPIKWAEIKLGLVEEDKDVRFVLEHPDYIIIDTVITIDGIKDWLRFIMYPNTGIDERLPGQFAVHVVPNPFNSSVAIHSPSGSDIEIFDINGRRLAAWENIPEDRIVWKPERDITSGLYFLRARFGDREIIKRTMYLK